jgi:hypothetical protein
METELKNALKTVLGLVFKAHTASATEVAPAEAPASDFKTIVTQILEEVLTELGEAAVTEIEAKI